MCFSQFSHTTDLKMNTFPDDHLIKGTLEKVAFLLFSSFYKQDRNKDPLPGAGLSQQKLLAREF